MKYTLPKSYSNAGIQVEIPESELRELRNAMGSTKAAIDKWLFENNYMSEDEYTHQHHKTEVNKREFKIDTEKAQIITMLAAVLNDADNVSDVNIANPNRLISFSIGENKYELTLIRKKK